VSTEESPEVWSFLKDRVAGVEDLEALLLVRSNTSRRWAADAVAAMLERSPSWAAPVLESLCLAGLLEATGSNGDRRFTYRPATPALESMVTALAELYADQRAELMRLLNENAVDRIRAAAARTFSGAFDGTREHEHRRRARKTSIRRRHEGGSESERGSEGSGLFSLRGRAPSGRTGMGGSEA
jgi:predicted transcriptional regulator